MGAVLALLPQPKAKINVFWSFSSLRRPLHDSSLRNFFKKHRSRKTVILCKTALLFCLIRKPIQLHFWQRGYLLDNLLLFCRRNDAILIVLPYNVTVRFMYKKLLPLHHIISHARLTWLNTQTMKCSILNLNTSNAYVTKRKRYSIDPQSYNLEN